MAQAPAAALPRTRVQALLAGAWERRVTLVIAGGGYGKTTALRSLEGAGRVYFLGLRSVDRDVEALSRRLAESLGIEAVPGLAVPTAAIGAEDRRSLAEGQAALLCEQLERRRTASLLVLDDVEQLEDESAAGLLLRALCLQAPPHVHIVLSGRRLPTLGLGTVSRPGELLEINAPDLAFTVQETAVLLDARLGERDEDLARACWSLSGGWAAALQLIVDRLARVEPERRRATLEHVPALSGQLWQEFVGDLLERESADARTALAIAAIAPVVDAELLVGLGIGRAPALLESLENRGLLVAGRETGQYAISPILGDVVAGEQTAPAIEELRGQTAGWLEAADRLGEALDCWVGGSPDATAAFLARRGHALVARGYGSRVAEVSKTIPTSGAPALEAVLGEALQSVGDWDGAIEMYRRVQRNATDGRLLPAIAWRFGALLYLRGESASCLDVLSAAHTEAGQTADDALVSAWLASVLWSRGEPETAAPVAAAALAQAERDGDPGALAAAHVALALVAASSGDRERNERHYRAALSAAGEAGDSIQLARIHANLSSRALEEGDYARAIDEAERGLAAAAGHRFFAALAMCNKADALLRLGELDDARSTLSDAIDTYAKLGSLLESAPHTLLGELYLERGDLTRARLSFERGRQLAEEAQDAHTLVFAAIGLARTLAEDDHATARAYAAEAVQRASSLERAQALCASALVELLGGDQSTAARFAADAEDEARRTRDRPSLAAALALRGSASRPPNEGQIEAAIELWDELGETIRADRMRLMLARIHRDGTAERALRAGLAARGVAPELWFPARAGAERGELVITTLGRFAVRRNGELLGAGAWQSRKARDLLKLLVARRGRSITREAAAESLWPGEPPAPLSNRLSVALSTLRRVLDHERSFSQDHFVESDGQSLALVVEHVSVDVLEFLAAADDGLSTAARGDLGAAEPQLRAAESLYSGDFLEEDLYEDWAVDCREAGRSAVLEVSRLLARAAARRGDDEAASRHLRRLLERDPYDGDAWAALVGAQSRLRRYGEARRQHALYARRMAELEVAPLPLAATLDAQP